MNENLPFINCNDVELSNVLSVERNLENIQNETMPKNKNKCNVLFAQYMPFLSVQTTGYKENIFQIQKNS